MGLVGANTHKATFTPDDTQNYNVVGDVAVTVTVLKAPAPAITFPEVLNAITYDQPLAEAKLAFYENEYGTFNWTAPNAYPDGVGQKNYALDFYPSDAALHSYDWENAAGGLWVERKDSYALCSMGRVQVNPADIAVANMDEDYIRRRLNSLLVNCKAHGNHVELIMKDNHTIANRPQNVYRWAQIAREEIDKVYG